MSNISVSSSEGLNAALKLAQAGDIIYLDSGTYSGIALRNITIDGNVTIMSKDLGHPATMTDLNVSGSTGFTFSNLELANTKVSDGYGFLVTSSKNITFSDVHVHGSLNDNAQDDISGLSILRSSNIKILNSEFQQLGRGVGVGDSQNVEISGNSFHDLQTDGVIVCDVQGINIIGNEFKNFFPTATDHPDAIQFLTMGSTQASENIVISENIIHRGTGAGMQGIFMRDEVGTFAYKNVTISDNILVGTGYNGIMVSHGENLKITGNELISYDGATNKNWVLIRDADGVLVEDNAAIQFGYNNVTGLVQDGNVINGAVSDEGKAALDAWTGSYSVESAEIPSDPISPQEVIGGGETPPPVVIPDLSAQADVTSSVSYTLSATAQNLLLTGEANVDGTGNDLSNVIVGNSGDNHLFGGAGNDTISDGYGADTMAGGAGDDTYYVNNPGKIEADVIVEAVGEGIDTVISSSGYALSDNVENLILTGKGGATGKGNDLDNVLIGNIGANILDGDDGNDTIFGGGGADTIVGRAGNDLLTGGAGDDTFWFQPGDGKDVISDFGVNGDHDSLDLSLFYRAGLKATLTDVGDNLVVSFKGGEAITLIGVHAHDLTATAKGFILA